MSKRHRLDEQGKSITYSYVLDGKYFVACFSREYLPIREKPTSHVFHELEDCPGNDCQMVAAPVLTYKYRRLT